jgi:UDP-N-acetylglucosamine diphosphorylase / glucose-1-phosphate thymidylyltransferase / UDP-N-acetylgalactosamine diphosphorylase / glucosamine-1-phosphate N-acetyltransferase / galactosamine-1-phosphate N-acetyltransferase
MPLRSALPIFENKNINESYGRVYANTNMQLIFRNSSHHLEGLTDENDIPATSLTVLGQPLIARNIKILTKIINITRIKIPTGCTNAIRLAQEYFPSIDVQEFDDDYHPSDKTREELSNTISGITNTGNLIIERNKEGKKGTLDSSHIMNNNSNSTGVNGGINTIAVPMNSLIRHNSCYGTNSNHNINNYRNTANMGLVVDSIVYPWDFLNAIEKVLQQEVTQTSISPNASVAKSSIINGPCIIEENVTIDDFCKINGPTYIGKGSSIGTGSLVRECMIGSNTKIGFSCETSRTYFAGDDEIAHLNIILDSVIGRNVWFGGFSGTANILVTKQNIKCEIQNGKSVDLGTNHFGSVVGNNCTIGTSVVLLPGRYVPANMVVQALGKIYQISKKTAEN